MHFSSHAPSRKQPMSVRFVSRSRIADPQYGNCFTSPFSCLLFGEGGWIFGKVVAPALKTSFCYTVPALALVVAAAPLSCSVVCF